MQEENTVDSTSNERTVNNLMRHKYRVLTDVEKAQMQAVKDLGLKFVEALHVIGGTDGDFAKSGENARLPSRELSLAQTNVEQAVMWAVKHITR